MKCASVAENNSGFEKAAQKTEIAYEGDFVVGFAAALASRSADCSLTAQSNDLVDLSLLVAEAVAFSCWFAEPTVCFA